MLEPAEAGRGPQNDPRTTLPTGLATRTSDRYVNEHGITREHYPAAFAPETSATQSAVPVPQFAKVEREEPPDGVVIEGDDLEAPGSSLGAGSSGDACFGW